MEELDKIRQLIESQELVNWELVRTMMFNYDERTVVKITDIFDDVLDKREDLLISTDLNDRVHGLELRRKYSEILDDILKWMK